MTELDSVDRALLVELQKDARQTNKALSAKVGVAPSTCLERVRELWSLIERPEIGRVQSSLVFEHAEGPGLAPLDA